MLAFTGCASTPGDPEPRFFLAAAGKAEITPDVTKPVWIAGFDSGRKATGISTPLLARAVVIKDREGNAVALVALDLLGLFYTDVTQVIAEIRQRTGISNVIIASTHTHHGPDTLGMWGPNDYACGRDDKYVASVRKTIADLVARLAAELRPAHISCVALKVPPKNLVRDGRDPIIIDDNLSAMVVREPEGPAICTIVNWACHPETISSKNTLISADYPFYFCEKLQKDLGGTAVFFSGPLGGMMTPESLRDENGKSMNTAEEAARIGETLAKDVEDALTLYEPRIACRIGFTASELLLPVDNTRYHLALAMGLMKREVFDSTGNAFKGPPSKENVPHIKTQLVVLNIGEAQFVTEPGEMFPELTIGGYDGSRTFGAKLIAADNPNPPDLSKAPAGPYLREMMTGKVNFIIGLGNDEIGYIVPEYDFQINSKSPLLEPQPAGDHYEETNSLGIHTAPLIMAELKRLLEAAR